MALRGWKNAISLTAKWIYNYVGCCKYEVYNL